VLNVYAGYFSKLFYSSAADLLHTLFITALQEAFEDFQELEDRITLVATKVVHLGDQLESSNNRRARDFEAETLMRYLAEFHAGPKPVSHIFSDPGQVMYICTCICACVYVWDHGSSDIRLF